MFCAISGKPPRFPVLSPHSKCIFEKQLIEQYVSDEGKDPITNSPLKVEELIEVSQNPEQSAFANSLNSSTLNTNYSIPNLLSSLQNEWDAVMLENFRLRKRLDECTKKLSVAFYERDAAKVVAAKAMKARDDIMREMNQLVSQIGTAEESEPVESEAVPPPLEPVASQLLERLAQESASYMKKTKKVSSGFNALDLKPFALATQWDVNGMLKLHRTTSLSLELQQELVFQLQDVSQVCRISGPFSHSVATVPFTDAVSYLAGASDDKLLFCNGDGKMGVCHGTSGQVDFAEANTAKIIFMENHEKILNDHFLWADESGTIGLTTIDCKETSVLIEGQEDEPFFQAAHHKDGLLLALANKDAVKIFDLSRPTEPSTNFRVGNEIEVDGEIREVRFSSNGYWMIVQCGSHLIGFDLRKSPGTLAVNPFELGPVDAKTLWDLDVSGKHLALLREVDESHHNLDFFSYQKAKKSWEPVDQKSVDISASGSALHEIKSFLMLYTTEGPAAVLQAREQVVLYSTE